MSETPYTYEQIMAMIAKTNENLDKTNASLDKTNAALDAFVEKTNVALERQREDDVKSKKEFEERLKKSDEEFQKRVKESEKESRELNKKIADLGDALGKFAVSQVSPRLEKMFRKKGIDMNEIYPNVIVKENGQNLFEIDLVLVNTIYAVAVEVKHNLKQKDVDEHIERLEKIEKMEKLTTRVVKGTKMYGAVAGMIVNYEVERYALKKGLYVVKPKGNGVAISEDPKIPARTWDVPN
jgi:hypothetical protein